MEAPSPSPNPHGSQSPSAGQPVGLLGEHLPANQLPAEAITVRIRWFGLCVGYLLVNVRRPAGRISPQLNAILTSGRSTRCSTPSGACGEGLSQPGAAVHLADGSGLHRPVVLLRHAASTARSASTTSCRCWSARFAIRRESRTRRFALHAASFTHRWRASHRGSEHRSPPTSLLLMVTSWAG